MKYIISFIGTVVFVIVFGICIINSVNMNRNCIGHLKRAADANTIELAEKELGIAVKYLEDNNLTSGYTSAIYETPDEDIEFWYNNLKASLNELHSVSPDASGLEKTNILMKLRETLLDNGDQGTYVTHPGGLSRYPHNLILGLLFWVSLCLMIFGWMYVIYDI